MRAKGTTLGSPDAGDPPRAVEGEYVRRKLPAYTQHLIDGELVDGGTVEVLAEGAGDADDGQVAELGRAFIADVTGDA